MSDTPESDKAKIAFTSLFDNDDAYWVPFKVSRKLELKLAAVTEERDELKSKYRTHHDEAERITNEIRRVSSVCRELREQRDRLAEALRQIDEARLDDFMGPHTMILKCVLIAREALAAVEGGQP
jgi:hypothetical protein